MDVSDRVLPTLLSTSYVVAFVYWMESATVTWSVPVVPICSPPLKAFWLEVWLPAVLSAPYEV